MNSKELTPWEKQQQNYVLSKVARVADKVEYPSVNTTVEQVIKPNGTRIIRTKVTIMSHDEHVALEERKYAGLR